MKLLILTQKVDQDDDVLGFMHGWIREFAKNCEWLIVICLEAGKYDFPANVSVLSLGKEKNQSRLKYLFNFYRYIWRERKNYDGVFVHMNQEYVLLGGSIWKVLRKKIGLWYAHGHTPFSLRISAKIANIIFTSTKGGFRLTSKKLKIIGQGIDTEIYKTEGKRLEHRECFKIITVGRLSPVKDLETLITATEILVKEKRIDLAVEIIGGPGMAEHVSYFQHLKDSVSQKQLEGTISLTFSGDPNDVAKAVSQHLFGLLLG